VYVTAVLNQKGGVGKTGLTAGVGGALAERGRRTLLVDLDPQGHLTTEALGLDEPEDDSVSLAAALTGAYTGPAAAMLVEHSCGASVLPTTLRMFTVGRAVEQLPVREQRLARLLEQLADRFDHVLLDCPPALDVLTDNALAACDGVLIPVQPERTSLRALSLLLDQVEALEDALRRTPIHLHGLVPLYRRPLAKLAASVMNDFTQLPLPILAHVPLSTTVSEAWAAGVPITTYAPDSDHAHAYRAVADVLDAAAGLPPIAAAFTAGTRS
jgi:chromosome partitioning protein